ncbi:MAG: hypothetical protein ABFD44_11740 [Anaerolineaceae bacterium]
MTTTHGQFKPVSTNPLTSIERQLQMSLQPVHPDQDFADTLRGRLTAADMVRMENEETSSNVLWLAFGLTLSAVGLALGLRWLQRRRTA